MGASAVNGSFAERPSLYQCVGEKRSFAEGHFFDAGRNKVDCSRINETVGTDRRTSPTSSAG